MTRFAGSLRERETDDQSSFPQANSRYGSERRRLRTERDKLDGWRQFQTRWGCWEQSLGYSGLYRNGTRVSIANLTHKYVESELASVAGVWKGMGFEAHETREGLFSHRARVRVRISFLSKFELVSSKAAHPGVTQCSPNPHVSIAWPRPERLRRRLSLNTSSAMLSTLPLGCVVQKANLDIRTKHLNEITKRIVLSAVLRNRIVQLAPVGVQSVSYEQFKTMDNA